MLESIKQYAFVYMPAEQYFASFSRKSDNFLMWSHYANNHSGFCLVFRSIDGKIRQSKKWKKSQLSYTTPHSFSPKMSFAIPDSFEIKDVEYVITPKWLNGFLCFPASVVRDKYTPTEIEEFLTDRDKIYWQKHSVWDYEEESRVVLSSGIPWLAGERLSLSPHQRLFHYRLYYTMSSPKSQMLLHCGQQFLTIRQFFSNATTLFWVLCNKFRKVVFLYWQTINLRV